MVTAMLVAGCSTQKNTSQSRWWHSFNAKYNTYYNGAQAYIDGSLEKEQGNKDNFTEMIPLYPVSNKSSRELGKGNYDKAIEKAQKAIHQHSIKKRPEWTKSRKKTAKDIEWLSRREYNPFLWKAWMLMGRAQFHQGAFDEAAATFSYMSRLYQSQPAIFGKARAWLAKCYVEEGWIYDAEDIIRNMSRDSMDWRAQKEWDYTMADYYIHTEKYEDAIPHLRKVIKHEMRRKQKAREWYLLGQLYANIGNTKDAYQAFKHVIRQNPPYELEFNARIAMTEVMSAGNAKQMISRLKRMAASDNNKDYLDQVYYAMGNIYMAQLDTVRAISAYEKGNEKSTRNGIEKGVLLLRLGNIYWTQEKFSDAKRCYGEAIGLLDKDRDDYEQLSNRSVVLDELVPFTEAIHLQDSLQALAKMPESERNAAIDRVIAELKRKEKEERDKLAEQDAAKQQQSGMDVASNNNRNKLNNQPQQNNQQDNTFYFYNPMAVSQGKTAFQRLWGKRENADNWQRINKTVVGDMGSGTDMDELTDEQRDSIYQAELAQDSLEQRLDSAQNDPHKREYYLAQIPFTEEQIAASNKILEDGLHHAGVIFKDKLDNLRLSEKHLRRLCDNYSDYEQMDDVYYHLFLLYSRKNMPVVADSYVTLLKDSFPDSQWTTLLTDPYFKENAKFGKHMEDSLYAATYDAFKAGRFSEVAGNTHISETRFPLGENRDKFLFIGGLSKLNDGDAEGCLKDMKTVVEKYPQSRISEMAGMIVNGVNAGKRLHGGKFDMENMWGRRNEILNDSDSLKIREFSPERLTDFTFILVYHPDSVKENKLLFEMARFNFTNFLVRNFDMEITDDNGLHRMLFSGFRSYDEAYQYAHELYRQESITQQIAKAQSLIISQQNLELIGSQFSYQDYDEFYQKNFSPLQVTQRYLLTEPAEIATPRERDMEEEFQSIKKAKNQEETNDENTIPSEDDTIVPADEDNNMVPTENDNMVPVEDEHTVVPIEDNNIVPIEDNNIVPVEDNNIVPVEDNNIVPVEDNNTIIPIENNSTTITVEENTFDVPEEPAIKATISTSKSEEPVTKQKKEEPVVNKKVTTPAVTPPKEEPSEEEDVIFFDDDLVPNNTPQKKSPQTPQNYNIEDEYYELDGF